MNGATDSVQSTGQSDASVRSIPDVDANKILDAGRTNQQAVLPNAVQSRLLGNLFASEPAGTELGTGVIATTDIATLTSSQFDFTVVNNSGLELVAIPDVAVYVGEINSDNEWPNSTYGMGSLPITVFNNWGLTNNKNVVTTVVVRNNFGTLVADVSVIIRWRLIVNAALGGGNDLNTGASNTTGGKGGGGL